MYKKIFNSHHSNKEKVIISPSKLKIYFKIPFYGKESFKISKNLTVLIKKSYPQVELSITYTSGKRINQFFGFNDTVAEIFADI